MRSLWVEYAKGIGIILVVYGHVARGLFQAHVGIDEPTYALVDSLIYSFHMPLFFFLSGLFFHASLKKRGWPDFVATKVDSLVYPYVLWTFLQGSIEVAMSGWTNSNVTVEHLFGLAWTPIAHFWFLYALFMVSMTGALVYTRVPYKFTPYILTIAMCGYLLKDAAPKVAALQYVLHYFCFFVTGIYFKEVQAALMAHRRTFLAVSLPLFVLAQYLFHITFGLTYTVGGLPSLALALVSIAFVVSVCLCLADKALPTLSMIGSSSMAIYLAHILAASGTRIVLSKFLHVHNIYVYLLLGCLMGIFAPILALRLSSRWGLGFLFVIPQRLSLETMRHRHAK